MTGCDHLLKETEFVVAATDYERLVLWQENARQSTLPPPRRRSSLDWQQIKSGCMFAVGTLAGLPVNIACIWSRLNGVLVMFYEACSRVTDSEMIDSWLRENCNPRWDEGRRRAHTNAMNFHLVIDYLHEAGALPAGKQE